MNVSVAVASTLDCLLGVSPVVLHQLISVRRGPEADQAEVEATDSWHRHVVWPTLHTLDDVSVPSHAVMLVVPVAAAATLFVLVLRIAKQGLGFGPPAFDAGVNSSIRTKDSFKPVEDGHLCWLLMREPRHRLVVRDKVIGAPHQHAFEDDFLGEDILQRLLCFSLCAER